MNIGIVLRSDDIRKVVDENNELRIFKDRAL